MSLGLPPADRTIILEPAAPEPATAPAYCLLSADGRVVASGEVFSRLIGTAAVSTPEVAAAIAAVTGGGRDLATVTLSGGGQHTLELRVEAVFDPAEHRLALISAPLPRPPDGPEAVANWFAVFAEESAALVWLKDLQGRYSYINGQYATALSADPARVRGRDDHELDEREAIDGPRVRAATRGGTGPHTQMAEPLRLEYTIPAHEQRPAFAALRFPVLDPRGEPLAVCGVASPADQGNVAARACEALLQVLEWFRADAQEIRRDALDRWGVTAVVADTDAAAGLSQVDAEALTAELAEAQAALAQASAGLAQTQAEITRLQSANADLEQSLGNARHELSEALARGVELETARDDALARSVELETACQEALARSVELEAARDAAQAQMKVAGQDEATHQAEIEFLKRMHEQELLARSEQLAFELTAAHDQELASLRRDFEQQRLAQSDHALELSDQQDRIRSELAVAQERHRSEINHLREQHAGQIEARAQALEQREERLRDLNQNLIQAERQTAELNTALASARAEIVRLKAAGSAAAKPAVSPEPVVVAEPVRAPEPTSPPARHEPVPVATPTPTAAVPPPTPPAPPTAEPADEPSEDLILSDQPLLIGDDPRPDPTPLAPAAASAAPRSAPGWDAASHQALDAALATCLNLRSILSETTRLVGTRGGWDAVIAWVPHPREERLACSATWMRLPMEMAPFETSMWQVRQDLTDSAIGAAAQTTDLTWLDAAAAVRDRHLKTVHSAGLTTVVVVPVSQQGQTFAVLELCSDCPAPRSAQADEALRSIALQIGAANQRVADAATASQWGRRRR